jgi:hypothetical protein
MALTGAGDLNRDNFRVAVLAPANKPCVETDCQTAQIASVSSGPGPPMCPRRQDWPAYVFPYAMGGIGLNACRAAHRCVPAYNDHP